MILDGTVLDMMDVYDDLEEYIDAMQYDVRSVGFDPYNAQEFIARWEKENGPYAIEKVIKVLKLNQFRLENSRSFRKNVY